MPGRWSGRGRSAGSDRPNSGQSFRPRQALLRKSRGIHLLDAAAQAACSPIDDKRGTVAFRTEVAGVLARRAAAIAYSRAKGE